MVIRLKLLLLKTAQACFLDGHPFELQSGMVIREDHINGIAGSSF